MTTDEELSRLIRSDKFVSLNQLDDCDEGRYEACFCKHDTHSLLCSEFVNALDDDPVQAMNKAWILANATEGHKKGTVRRDDVYFEDFRTKGKFDYMSKIKKPFQLLPGGYQIIYKNGKWSNVFGSKEKEHDFRAEDRRGHRSEIRKSRGL